MRGLQPRFILLQLDQDRKPEEYKMARIYVLSLEAESYNVHHGEWIELDCKDLEEVQEEIDEMLGRWKNGEWIIADREGLTTYGITDLSRLIELAEAIEEHGEDKVQAFLNCNGKDLDTIDECSLGDWDDQKDFAENSEMFEHIHREAEKIEAFAGIRLAAFIDWDSIGRDALLSGLSSTRVNGRLYVFQI